MLLLVSLLTSHLRADFLSGHRLVAQNSLNMIANNVDTFANQLAIELPGPVLPSSDDYIFWLADPKNKTYVYANRNTFSIAAANNQPTSSTSNVPPTTPPVASPVHTTSAEHPSICSLPAEDGQGFADKPRHSGTASFNVGVQPLVHNNSPSSSSCNSPSIASIDSPQTQPVIGASRLRKPISGGSIAGIAIAAVFLLALGVVVWLCPKPYLHGGNDKQESPQRLIGRGEKLRVMPQGRISGGQGGGDLELALRQNDALAARIAALESDMRSSRMGSGWSHQSPPGYLD
ncbi:hypothetical protein B0H17DRAFT_1133732 [Mycena rosella]|uniref:Uncharacterized protein n=1 Tax=Mycena rosella TaxID=1033263 RepID=A0AAD7GHQ6_MYCRO|nr:hypothetical protein B0H17DRAFT_1133732 [Mycena rosella]